MSPKELVVLNTQEQIDISTSLIGRHAMAVIIPMSVSATSSAVQWS